MLKSIPRTRLGEINWGVWLRSWHLMWTCSYSSVTARMIRVFIYMYIYRTLCVRQNLYVHMQIAANIFVFLHSLGSRAQLRMRHGACLQVPFQFRSKGHLHRMANSADVPKILHSVCWNVNSGRSWESLKQWMYIYMYVCIYNSWIIAVILASTHHMGKYVYPPAITCGPGKSLTYNTIKKNIRPFLYYTWFMYIYICIYTNKSAFAWQASSQRASTLYIPFLAEIGIWSTEQTFEGEKMQLRASTGVLAALWNPIGGWIPL